MSEFKTLKAECYEANMELPQLGLVIYTFGNVSVADHSKGVFAIKPSGVPYEKLVPEDMVILDFENRVVEGKLRPSSDTRTHSYLYREWPSVGGICHTHSTYATAWAQAQRDIPIMGTTHADFLTHDIPCAPPMSDELIAGDYEHNTGQQIIDCLRERQLNPNEVEMVLIGNHAPFAWGKDGAEAVYHARVLEELAKMAYLAMDINPGAPRLKESLIRKHYNRKHGGNAYYGQNNDND